MGAFTLIPEKSSFWTAKTQLSLNCMRPSRVGLWFPPLERDSPSSCKIMFLNNVSAFDGGNSRCTWPGIGTNGLAERNPGIHPCGCQIESSIFGEFVWHKVRILNNVSLGKFDVSRFRNSWMWQVMATEHVYGPKGENNWIKGLEMEWLEELVFGRHLTEQKSRRLKALKSETLTKGFESAYGVICLID